MELADGLNETLVVLVAHTLNVLVVVLYAVAETLQEIILLLPIVQSAAMLS